MKGFGLLSLLTWLPIVGGLVVLFLGDRCDQARPLGGARHRARRVRALDPAVYRLQRRDRRVPVRRTVALDPGVPLDLLPRRRRHFDAAHPAHDVHHHPGGDRRMDGDRLAARAVLRRVPDHGRPDDRRVRRGRWPAVLFLLGSDAHPDVPDHRRVGRSAARVRDHQVLPVHVPRQRVHAGRADLHVSEDRRLQHRRVPRPAVDDGRAALDLPRVPGRIRGQDPDGAGAHVVAGCARRSPHGRLGGAGGHHAEDGRIRLPEIQPAHHAGCEPRARLVADHCCR